MKLSKPSGRAVIIVVSAFVFLAIVIFLKNWHQSSSEEQVPKRKGVIRVSHAPDTTFIPKFWKYHAGDDVEWANSDIDDSNWNTVNPELNLNEIPQNLFSGICWFRATIFVDSAHAGNVYGIDFNQNGASEIYWDGKLIQKYGIVAGSPENEEPYRPGFSMFFFSGASGYHHMAIRYSNQRYLEYFYSVYEEEMAGISMNLILHPDVSVASEETRGRLIFSLSLLCGFFFTLGLVHFLLFIFYRVQVQNLYYSMFAFCFSACFLTLYLLITTTNPALQLFCNHFFVVLVVMLLLFLVMLLHSLFQPRAAKVTFVISLSIALLITALQYISTSDFWNILLIFYFMFTCIELIRSIVEGFWKKLPGSRIIGIGTLIFALFLSLLMLTAVIMGNLSFNSEGDSAYLFIVLLVSCLVSLPLSMSVYLAYEFSLTNRNLSKKLTEVEVLSAKAIEQEKEKQEILSTQKENLEIQVIERTREVVLQKKVIEERNKDITDSINYAKRIQDAILPSEEQVKNMIPDCFVLYKPKDIVSGDFYFFAETNGRVVIAAVDCTGHGVPGAFMSMVGYNHLKRMVHEQGLTDTSKILDELHKQVLHSMNRDIAKRDSKDGMDVAIVSIDKERRELQFSGAVRPLYYFDSMGFHEVKGERYSIAGIKEIGSDSYVSTTIMVMQPTAFYIFSDGFTDQFGGKDGKKIMSKNFKELLNSIQSKSMNEQRIFLDNFIEEWKSGREQIDDIMVIGIRL